MGIDPNADPEEGTEEDIREMVDVGNEKGLIPQSEREMIYNIFEFDDRTAEDVMTHRTEIEAVEVDDDIDEALKIAIEKGFQEGGDLIRGQGVRVESLAIIDKMDVETGIVFRD